MLSRKRGQDYPKFKDFASRLNAILFLWVVIADFVYYLRSRILAPISPPFCLILLIFVFANRDILRSRFEVDSKKHCEKVTMGALLGGIPFLIELARRTSVNFATGVWALLIIAVFVPIFPSWSNVYFREGAPFTTYPSRGLSVSLLLYW